MIITSTGWARDDVDSYSAQEALSLAQAQEILGSEIAFYFGNQKHGSIVKNFGEVSTNKKTNAIGKSDKEACQWVFLSAMKALKNRAIREGGNAVINIVSNYKKYKVEIEDNDSFLCGAGTIMAGVALKGTIVLMK
jgi:uncharacterized protein YbjQ (UPF0145 family)